MTLGFSQEINGVKTNFIGKIWSGFNLGYPHYLMEYGERCYWMDTLLEKSLIDINEMPYEPKIHSIRKDPKNRWKVGHKIHFVINNRTKNRFQFAPVLEVFSIQKIKIYPQKYIVDVDGRILSFDEMKELSKNDGFDSLEDFFSYFNTYFEGKIIHWTTCKY